MYSATMGFGKSEMAANLGKIRLFVIFGRLLTGLGLAMISR